MSGGANRMPEARTASRRQRSAVGARSSAGLFSLRARRRIVRFGVSVPIVFIGLTLAVASTLGQPLRGPFDVAELGLWAVATAVLCLPFVSALIVMFTARRGGLVWSTSLTYTVIAGLLGLGVDISVLSSGSSTASTGLASALIVQVLLLAPLSAAVAFVVHNVTQRHSATRSGRTGKNFDRE